MAGVAVASAARRSPSAPSCYIGRGGLVAARSGTGRTGGRGASLPDNTSACPTALLIPPQTVVRLPSPHQGCGELWELAVLRQGGCITANHASREERLLRLALANQGGAPEHTCTATSVPQASLGWKRRAARRVSE